MLSNVRHKRSLETTVFPWAGASNTWSIIPVQFDNGKKKAAAPWKVRQTIRPSPALLKKWDKEGRFQGLAVVLGAVSGNLTCRDFDEAQAYHVWAKDHPELAAALPTVKTGRGYHVYFVATVPKTIDQGDGDGHRRTRQGVHRLSQTGAPPGARTHRQSVCRWHPSTAR
jgi:hypothetical protein